ncbi:Arc family DNA-binding protein [Janthinobacterium sp. MDT1-19]|uniref:Arc family DNA-binding protein n=1 Tax=Janthinobacterium sp. MDT1-19 TaxID=1259339 RepID=UPI003F286DFA
MSNRFFASNLKESHTPHMEQPKQQNSYPLRMPSELRQRLEARAKASGRSVNAEIVEMLSAALDGQPATVAELSSGALLHEVIERYGAKVQIVVSPEVAEEAQIPTRLTPAQI